MALTAALGLLPNLPLQTRRVWTNTQVKTTKKIKHHKKGLGLIFDYTTCSVAETLILIGQIRHYFPVTGQ